MASPTDRRRGRRHSAPRRELSFGPARDTGITLGSGRRGRHRGKQDSWVTPLVAIIAVFLLSALAISGIGGASRLQRAALGGGSSAPIGAALDKLVRPTPVFATCGTLRLHLPVPAETITAVAFHQASFNNALALESLAPTIDLVTASRIAAAKRAAKTATVTPAPNVAATSAAIATAATVPSDIWGGKVIRLWRSGRSGKPETAVDVGAAPGTPVVSPVDGTVVYIRQYKLYAKYDDYEVHISPTGSPGVDVVLIHITGVCVTPGQTVEAGVTKIATVRKLSKYTSLQLAEYTADGGDHAHLQVNRTPSPGSLWVSTPAGPVVVPFQGSLEQTQPTAEALEP
jgi:murein DD-endopeptidase MepM/ murein hydrolase activator NlpD